MAITSLCITLAVLSIRPNRSQFFQYDSFAVSCTADSSGWTVKRNTSVHVDQECHRSGGVPGESLCVIEMAYPSDTGVYWCENERGRSSNAVSISVTYAGVILESPPHPLTDGDNVTLSCFYKTETRRTATSDFTANFYKNGVLLGSGAAGRMILTAVSRSDEGLYRCEHPDGEESEESWLTVRDRAQCGAAAPPLMSRTKLLISSLLFIFYNVFLILFFLKYRLWTRGMKKKMLVSACPPPPADGVVQRKRSR
ncbi:Fc receptor-like protein 5 isoform X1 [Oryzias latipes]